MEEEILDIEDYKKSVSAYVAIEQCVAVLSDFKSDCSYIYPGNFGEYFGMPFASSVIDSAFEDCIFNKINRDDVTERHALELQYFQYILKACRKMNIENTALLAVYALQM